MAAKIKNRSASNGVDGTDKVEATFKNGVSNITLPQNPRAQHGTGLGWTGRYAEETRTQLETTWDNAMEAVREKPATSTAVACGLGLLVGALLTGFTSRAFSDWARTLPKEPPARRPGAFISDRPETVLDGGYAEPWSGTATPSWD